MEATQRSTHELLRELAAAPRGAGWREGDGKHVALRRNARRSLGPREPDYAGWRCWGTQRNRHSQEDRIMANDQRKGRGRGFASMDPQKQREIASKGGRAAHLQGTAHEWSSDEAREAGRKGGAATRREA